MKIAIAIALLTAACSPATMRHTLHHIALGTEIAAQGSLVCDASSTHMAIELGGHEQNLVMGDHPGDGMIAGYFLASSAAVYGVNRVLPDALRIILNTVIVGAEIAAVQGNSSWGTPACGL